MTELNWQESVFDTINTSGVELVAYVPDIAGHSTLIQAAKEKFHTRGSVRFLHALVDSDQPERVMLIRDGVENKLRFRKAVNAEGI